MDASQHKGDVFVLLFMKYVTDKYAVRSNALIDPSRGGSFTYMVRKSDKEVGEKIKKNIAKLAEANDLKCVIAYAWAVAVQGR